MEFIKRQTVGVWMTLCTLILSVISFIIYNANIAGAGYFHGASVDTAVRYMVGAIVIGVCVIVLAQLPGEGIVGKVITIISDIARIVVPSLSIAAVLALVSARVEGFAFIYFSNAEVLQEVQTPANISSAHGAIATIVALAVTAIVGIVGAFFSTKKFNS